MQAPVINQTCACQQSKKSHTHGPVDDSGLRMDGAQITVSIATKAKRPGGQTGALALGQKAKRAIRGLGLTLRHPPRVA
jgi:hypothetical protein